MNLSFKESINKQRVKRILDFCSKSQMDLSKSKVLDIGSGLCVFLAEFLKYGIEGYCIDPDPVAVRHAKKNIGVKGAYNGSFLDYRSGLKFDFIAFNKVLEHVTDPIALLVKAKTCLKKNGFIYVELPDAENALRNGKLQDREEFFIDHYTVSSERSMEYLINKSGYRMAEKGAIHDPADKYTLYAFCYTHGES